MLLHRGLAFCLHLVCAVLLAKGQVLFGIDQLEQSKFALLSNKRVVLVTHAAARAVNGMSTLEVFASAQNVTIVRLLTPEHGFYGVVAAGKSVPDDTVAGIPAVSLYGPRRRPDKTLLENADVVVVDLQDIGIRSYTYVSTMIEVMEACAKYNVPLVVLDRANPLGGQVVDGNVPDDTVRSFISRIPVPYIHGMTLGEIATMANGEGWLEPDARGTPRKCSLTVVRCAALTRSMVWADLRRTWYPTSPNIPTLAAVRGCALTGLLGEIGVCSIGMGTATPFTALGTPDFGVDTLLVTQLLNNGVIAAECRFRPLTGKWANTVCSGYYLDSRSDWQPYRAALTILWRLRNRFPTAFTNALNDRSTRTMFLKACGSQSIITGLLRGASLTSIQTSGTRGLEDFRKVRLPYLLYPNN